MLLRSMRQFYPSGFGTLWPCRKLKEVLMLRSISHPQNQRREGLLGKVSSKLSKKVTKLALLKKLGISLLPTAF